MNLRHCIKIGTPQNLPFRLPPENAAPEDGHTPAGGARKMRPRLDSDTLWG